MLKNIFKKTVNAILIGVLIGASIIPCSLYISEPKNIYAATAPRTTTGGGFDVYIDLENNVSIIP